MEPIADDDAVVLVFLAVVLVVFSLSFFTTFVFSLVCFVVAAFFLVAVDDVVLVLSRLVVSLRGEVCISEWVFLMIECQYALIIAIQGTVIHEPAVIFRM